MLLGAGVQAVDGLEFNRELRVADVGYDFAFLVMDVARRDDELARALVRGYRGAGGDPGSDELLAFLCAIRALVRAKIDLLRAAQLTGRAGEDRTARGLEMLAIAEALLRPGPTACPGWCVTRLAGGGVRPVAEALAAAAGWTICALLRPRASCRAGIDPHEHAAPSAYDDNASRGVYAELAQRATLAVRRDGGVIVEATFRRDAEAPDAFAAASAAAATASWLVCEAPAEVLLERARERALQPSVSDAGPEIVAAELVRYGGPFTSPGPPLARLATTRPVAELLRDLAAVLDARVRAGEMIS